MIQKQDRETVDLNVKLGAGLDARLTAYAEALESDKDYVVREILRSHLDANSNGNGRERKRRK